MTALECEHVGMTLEKSICGQITIFVDKTEDVQFELLCSICSQNFKQFNDFVSHIKVNHLTFMKVNNFRNIEYNSWNGAKQELENGNCSSENSFSPDIEFEEALPSHLLFIDAEIKNEVEDSILLPYDVLNNLTTAENDSILPQLINDNLSESGSTITEEEHINNNDRNLKEEDSPENLTETSDASNEKNVKKTKANKLFCSFCDRPFNNSFKLKCHTMIHTGELPFECETCKKRFRMKATLDAHKTTHLPPEERKFQCEICGLKITTKQSYNSHMRRHVKDYRFECEICKKQVYTSIELKIHMKKHSNEKPYVCEICGVSYKWKEAMDRHMSRHSGQRNYKCDQCEMAFFCPRSRREHVKAVHAKLKNNKCEVCGAAFARRYTLYQHRKLHSDVKEYTCTVCNKAFAQAATLRAHMKTHKN